MGLLRLVAVVVLGLAGPVRADDLSAAKAVYQEGKRLYDQGDYRGALVKFKASYLRYDSPALLYNIGQCHLKLGEKAEALNFFHAYLKTRPDPELEALVADLEGRPRPVITAPQPPPEPEVTSPPPPARPLVKKPWFWAAVGGAAVVVGVALGVGLGVGLSKTEYPGFSSPPTHGAFRF